MSYCPRRRRPGSTASGGPAVAAVVAYARALSVGRAAGERVDWLKAGLPTEWGRLILTHGRASQTLGGVSLTDKLWTVLFFGDNAKPGLIPGRLSEADIDATLAFEVAWA